MEFRVPGQVPVKDYYKLHRRNRPFYMNDVAVKHQNKPKDPVQTVKRKEVLIVLPFLGYHVQQTPHKTAEVLYKQILWYLQRQNSFSKHPKNQVLFPLQRQASSFFQVKSRVQSKLLGLQ